MGVIRSIAKVIFFPVYAPYELGKKALGKQEPPIFSIITTKSPEVYEYYFEGLGHRADVIGDNVIVWRKGIGEKERKEVLGKIEEKLKSVV
jgi:hypothetical protein